jgi:hypothetical protein
MIEWNKRARRDETQMAERRTWNSKCGHYKVEECNIKFGRSYDRRGNYLGYPIFYRAMALLDGVWRILSAHRKRGTAIKQCEYWHEKGCLMPKNTKAAKAKKRQKAKRKAKRNDN